MKAQFVKPPPTISACVKGILVIEEAGRAGDFTLPLFANGMPTLVFQNIKANRGNQSLGHLTLFGQQVSPSMLTLRGDFTLIAFFFYPYVLDSLFKVSGASLADESAPLDVFKVTTEFALQEKLLNAPSIQEQLKHMMAFLELLISRKADHNKNIVFATTGIERAGGLKSLAAMQKEMNISERTFQRLFETHVGISPKMYRRICQFDAAFRQLNADPSAKLSDVAYQHGFADQSHFIRVFKEFAGCTPRQYLDRLAQYIP